MDPRVTLPDPIAEVFITEELYRRASASPGELREKLAIQDLATQMSNHPGGLLPHLVKLAMKICRAESAGINMMYEKI